MDTKQILEINRHFYESYAKEFSLTRQAPWQGWQQILDKISHNFSSKRVKILDLGCGNGRFYKFLKQKLGVSFDYTGVDISKSLIEEAKETYKIGNFEVKNFIEEITEFKGKFNVICGFGILHHIPTKELRNRFLEAVTGYLRPGGMLVLTLWTQIPDQNKIKETDMELEQGDYLVKWDKNEEMFRYIHVFTKDEVEEIKENIHLALIDEYEADKSNIYLIWQK